MIRIFKSIPIGLTAFGALHNSVVLADDDVANTIAKAASYIFYENFYYLRRHMLEPGRTYGWEGLYSSDEERYYADGQYVYHSQYLAAIEELMGAPLHQVIQLTDREKKRIDDLVADPGHESHHWAIWISRKLER